MDYKTLTYLEKDFGNYTFRLSTKKRGLVTPEICLGYPEYFLDVIGFGARCAGRIYIDDVNREKPRVTFYPDGEYGYDVESIGLLNKYVNHVQKNWKVLKENSASE